MKVIINNAESNQIIAFVDTFTVVIMNYRKLQVFI